MIFHGSGESGAPSTSCPGEKNQLNRAHTNADSLATGKANIQFWGFNDTWGGQNYGIPSGTYTPSIGVNGYYEQSPQEQVSVTLSGNPTSISDHLFRAPGFNVTVTSIDWERPRVSRPWVWGGCQDAGGFSGNLQGTQDGGPAQVAACTGSEIDVGFYPVVNGTAGSLADYLGDEPAFLPPSLAFGLTGLYQGGYSTNEIPCPFQGTGVPDNSTCGSGRGWTKRPCWAQWSNKPCSRCILRPIRTLRLRRWIHLGLVRLVESHETTHKRHVHVANNGVAKPLQ